MEYLDNTGRQRPGDALTHAIGDDARLSIIASYFTVFAYGELKEELSKVDELRFIFDQPTFAKRMESEKEPREWEIRRRERELGVAGAVIDQLETLYRENPPELVYFMTLYRLFRGYMEDQEDPIRPELGLERSVVWNKLYDFQKDAVVGAIRKLEKYKGCIVADSVGLGKTYKALAVIKYYEERNARVLVIDESHNFRNKSTDSDEKDRYTRLIEDVIKAGVRTKVLMLSATPVNNKLLDLRNQIELITEGDDAYLADTDGIPSITHVTRVAQQRFNEWSKLADEDRTTESFVVLR